MYNVCTRCLGVTKLCLARILLKTFPFISSLNEGRGKQQFEVALKQLFGALNILMLYTSNTTVLQQGAALKYIPTTIPFVMTVFDPQELR